MAIGILIVGWYFDHLLVVPLVLWFMRPTARDGKSGLIAFSISAYGESDA